MTPTPEQMIREVVEATPGECWHETNTKSEGCCYKCGKGPFWFDFNPSPDDLKALFRLARKNGICFAISSQRRLNGGYACNAEGCDQQQRNFHNPAEPLLTAIWKAVKK